MSEKPKPVPNKPTPPKVLNNKPVSNGSGSGRFYERKSFDE